MPCREHARELVSEEAQRRTREAASALEATTATTRRLDAQIGQLQQLEATAKAAECALEAHAAADAQAEKSWHNATPCRLCQYHSPILRDQV